AREASDEAKGRKDGLLREIRHHAQPREKSPLRWVEAGGCESVRQKLPLEIKRNKGELPGNRDRHLGEPLALPCLSGLVIDLEDAQGLRQGGPVRVGVETRAEHHELSDASLDGGGEGVFGEARSHRDESPQPSLGGIVWRTADGRLGIRPQDARGQWI